MNLNIRRRSDGAFNLWREDFLLPEVDPLNVRASSWQVIAVTESHEEAVKIKDRMRSAK